MQIPHCLLYPGNDGLMILKLFSALSASSKQRLTSLSNSVLSDAKRSFFLYYLSSNYKFTLKNQSVLTISIIQISVYEFELRKTISSAFTQYPPNYEHYLYLNVGSMFAVGEILVHRVTSYIIDICFISFCYCLQ